MPSAEEIRDKELRQTIQQAQATADREVDLARHTLVVSMRHAAHVRRALRIINRTPDEKPQGGSPGVAPKIPVQPEKSYAGQVVWGMSVAMCPDGSVWFRVNNDADWWTLEPRLADYLKFLAYQPDRDHSGDGLVGFRSREEILAHLEKTGGRSYNAQYVNKLTSKLKDKLRENDLDIPIVSGKLGVRVLVAAGCVELVQLNTIPAHKRASGAR